MSEKFCGNFTLEPFRNYSLGICFLELYIFFPICSFYFLTTIAFFYVHWKHAAFDNLQHKIYWVRFGLAFSVLCSSSIAAVLSYFLPFIYGVLSVNTPFEVTHHAVLTVLWVVMLLHDYFHGKSVRFSSRGPLFHLLLSILYFYLSVAVVWSAFRQEEKLWSPFFIFRALHLSLVVLHLLSKVPVIYTIQQPRHYSDACAVSSYTRLHDQNPVSSLDYHLSPEHLARDARRSVSGEDSASFISKVFFCWMSSTVAAGYNGEITNITHLPPLSVHLNAEALESRLPLTSEQKDFSTFRSFMRLNFSVFGKEFLLLSGIKLLLGATNLCAPVFLNYFILTLSSEQVSTSHAVGWGVAVILTTFASAILGTNYDYQMATFGFKLRISLTGMIYRAILSTPLTSLNTLGTGSVINYLTVDTDRIVNLANSLQELWAMPLQLILAVVLLYRQLGISSLVGVGFLLLLLPLNRVLASQIGKYSTRLMQSKDARIKLMSEILSNMTAIKVACWEHLMHSRVSQSRSTELKALWGQKLLDAICVFFWAACPAVLACSTFATYSTLGNHLDASVIFTSLALFGMLIGPMNSLPWVINGVMEATVSIRRICCLLSLPRGSFSTRLCSSSFAIHSFSESGGSQTTSSDPLISIACANFHWTESGNPVLYDISLRVTSGQLIGIIGPVGSGKSALLLAILGELCSGTADCTSVGTDDPHPDVPESRPRCAYLGQTPWLFSGTIRDNILLGSVCDPVWLKKVLFACALDTDLASFPSGIDTDVGESGGSRLSGGQRTRVALARAVYQQADVYLLDDPLSALDVRVAEHVIEHCLLGLLANKARIVTSSHKDAWFTRKSDSSNSTLSSMIMELKEGRIVDRFTSSDSTFVDCRNPDYDVTPLTFQPGKQETADDDVPLLDDVRDQNATSPYSEGIRETAHVEQLAVGAIDTRVYYYYFRSVGYCLGIGVILSLFLMQTSRNAADWWLAHWVQETSAATTADSFSLLNVSVCELEPLLLAAVINISGHSSESRPWSNLIPVRNTNNGSFYLSIYGGIVAGHVIVTTFRAVLFALSGLAAATFIHRRALETVLQACVFYFDRTPQGRILNRFSSDVGTIDDGLPFILNIFLANIAGLLGVTVVACLALPSLVIILLPLTFIFWSVQRAYRGAARDLKRISSVSRSPVYAHFVDTLSGLAVIRGLGKENRFRQLTATVLGDQLRADLASLAAGSWLSIRLQLISTGVVASVVFLTLAGNALNWIHIATAGLSTAYALGIANLMTSTVYVATETEKNFVAVERCRELTDQIPVEMGIVPVTATAPVPRNQCRHAGLLKTSVSLATPELSPEWPSLGCLEFRNVSLTYQRTQASGTGPSLLALNNISFLVRPGEKVGIIGRTGSGKSSIFRVLLRLVDHLPGPYTNLDLAARRDFVGASGLVFIDGMDVRSVPLCVLRSRILTIIQEPFLFSGILRDNLDPSGTLPDCQLREVLQKCQLALSESEAQEWLLRDVGEAGRNISAGQRQLICLARALLRKPKSKIVCLDEATAAVDDGAEEIIHDVLDNQFRDSTVLLIAHRLSAVKRFCSRIFVMHAGRLVADGDVNSLLDSESIPTGLESRDVVAP